MNNKIANGDDFDAHDDNDTIASAGSYSKQSSLKNDYTSLPNHQQQPRSPEQIQPDGDEIQKEWPYTHINHHQPVITNNRFLMLRKSSVILCFGVCIVFSLLRVTRTSRIILMYPLAVSFSKNDNNNSYNNYPDHRSIATVTEFMKKNDENGKVIQPPSSSGSRINKNLRKSDLIPDRNLFGLSDSNHLPRHQHETKQQLYDVRREQESITTKNRKTNLNRAVSSNNRDYNAFDPFASFTRKKDRDGFDTKKEVHDHSSLSLADIHTYAYHTHNSDNNGLNEYPLIKQNLKLQPRRMRKRRRQNMNGDSHSRNENMNPIKVGRIESQSQKQTKIGRSSSWNFWPFLSSAADAASTTTSSSTSTSLEPQQRRVDTSNQMNRDNKNKENRNVENDGNETLIDEATIFTEKNSNNNSTITSSQTSIPDDDTKPASEVLQCRESVIAFVINATDRKDECIGLIRAFEQTCVGNHITPTAALSANNEKSGSPNKEQSHHHLNRFLLENFNGFDRKSEYSDSNDHYRSCDLGSYNSKRPKTIIFEKELQLEYILLRLHALAYKTFKLVKWLIGWSKEDEIIRQWIQSTDIMNETTNDVEYLSENDMGTTLSDFLIIEDYYDAKYLVQNNLVNILFHDTKESMEKEVCYLNRQDDHNENIFKGYHSLTGSVPQEPSGSNNRHRSLEQSIADIEASSDPGGGGDNTNHQSMTMIENKTIAEFKQAITNTRSSTNRTKQIQLRIPTKLLYLSDQTAVDTLILNQGEKIIQDAVEQSTDRKQRKDEGNTQGDDIDKSIEIERSTTAKNSVHEVSEAISVIFNDPASVEARTCCASIIQTYHFMCNADEEQDISDSRLFFCVAIMACCGVVKSLIRYYRILWLPEAAGCILVGVASGYVIFYFPHHNVSFDGNWFLRILVPPIIFQAALSIDKRSFNRHIVPIIIYSVAGTIVATCLTALILHYGTRVLSKWCMSIPFVEALTFGALISSIDPIAVLSVLNNMGMTDTDTIYVLIFGESLLNDGVAIVLFHTLVHFLDENLVIDQVAINRAAIHFFVVAFGSLLVGVAAGMMSTVYFWIFQGCQTPLVEVIMFFCWALFPYYVCDGIGWSGIVASVAVGFVMDLYIVGRHSNKHHHSITAVTYQMNGSSYDCDDTDVSHASFESGMRDIPKRDHSRRHIFGPKGHLSIEARVHIGFVTEIISTSMETAIFAYLGFFLFSHRYHWNFFHILVAIVACCLSRAVMIPSLGLISNWITRFQQVRHKLGMVCPGSSDKGAKSSKSDYRGVFIDRNMQIALWFAGLRGAMSFALVEHIPLYDASSQQGTRLKPELKAMTSASILFTVFVLGGYTYYMMQRLGIAPQSKNKQHGSNHEHPPLEIMALIPSNQVVEKGDDNEDGQETLDYFHFPNKESGLKLSITPKAVRRQRAVSKKDDVVAL